jgi:hypothetical protein
MGRRRPDRSAGERSYTLSVVARTGAAKTYSPNGHGDGASGPAPAGDGHADGPPRSSATDENPPSRPPGPSTHLAVIVVAIAAGLTLVGGIASAFVGGTAAPVTSSAPTTARGSPLRAVAARPLLSSIISDGLPPTDILTALTLPKGSHFAAGSSADNGVGLYDHSANFSILASENDVIEFFRAELPSDRWTQITKGPPSNGVGYQIIGQHPGSDGYEWEVGITVMPETFSSAPSGATSSAHSSSSGGTTPFTLRLFQESDDQ